MTTPTILQITRTQAEIVAAQLKGVRQSIANARMNLKILGEFIEMLKSESIPPGAANANFRPTPARRHRRPRRHALQ